MVKSLKNKLILILFTENKLLLVSVLVRFNVYKISEVRNTGHKNNSKYLQDKLTFVLITRNKYIITTCFCLLIDEIDVPFMIPMYEQN